LTFEINAFSWFPTSMTLSLLCSFQDRTCLSPFEFQSQLLSSIYSIGEGKKFKLTSNQVQEQQPEEGHGIKKNLYLADTRRSTMLQAQER